jgi:uncharacterized protein YuzE
MLSFDFDPEADALAILVADGLVARTIEIDPGTLVDVDGAGRALTIELIRPNRLWPIDEVVDEFDIEDDDAVILRSLWSSQKPFPFAEPALALTS